jgi:hypothetical protein
MANFPVDFEAKAREAKSASGGGYPVQLSAADLMRNFVMAALEVDPSLVEDTTGQGGHAARKLKIPAVPGGGADPLQLTATGGALSWAPGIPTPPAGGTHVLGAVDGALQWIATEEC